MCPRAAAAARVAVSGFRPAVAAGPRVAGEGCAGGAGGARARSERVPRGGRPSRAGRRRLPLVLVVGAPSCVMILRV